MTIWKAKMTRNGHIWAARKFKCLYTVVANFISCMVYDNSILDICGEIRVFIAHIFEKICHFHFRQVKVFDEPQIRAPTDVSIYILGHIFYNTWDTKLKPSQVGYKLGLVYQNIRSYFWYLLNCRSYAQIWASTDVSIYILAHIFYNTWATMFKPWQVGYNLGSLYQCVKL